MPPLSQRSAQMFSVPRSCGSVQGGCENVLLLQADFTDDLSEGNIIGSFRDKSSHLQQGPPESWFILRYLH